MLAKRIARVANRLHLSNRPLSFLDVWLYKIERDLVRASILCPPALAPDIGAEMAVSRIGRKTAELPGKSLIYWDFIGARPGPGREPR